MNFLTGWMRRKPAQPPPVTSVSFGGSGRIAFLAGHSLHVGDSHSGRESWCHRGSHCHVAFDAHRSLFATGRALLHADTGKRILSFPFGSEYAHSSSGGGGLGGVWPGMATTWSGGLITLWQYFPRLHYGCDRVARLAVPWKVLSVRDGKGAGPWVAAAPDGLLHVLSLYPTAMLGWCGAPGTHLAAFAVSDDGRFAVLGTDEGRVALYDLQPLRDAGEKFFRREAARRHGSVVGLPAPWWASIERQMKQMVNPDRVPSVSEGQRKLWQVAVHIGAVRGLALSPDGTWIAAAGADGAVSLLEAASGDTAMRLEAHPGGAHSVAFNSDGRLLASGGEDCRLRLWEFPGGSPAGGWKVELDGRRRSSIHSL